MDVYIVLRRYDTIKTCRWNFLSFPELFTIVKYVKMKGSPCLKTRGHLAIFSVLEVKRSKMLQKLNKETVLFTFFVLVFMAFPAQKLIYTIIIWFNFVFGLFFEQDHLLKVQSCKFRNYIKPQSGCSVIGILWIKSK